jgi:PAS domain S-box-containing protein
LEREAIDFRRLGEESNELIVAFDAQFRYTYVNPNVERLIGTPREQLLGRTVWEVAPPSSENTVYAEYYRRAMREQITVEFEAYYPPRDRWNWVKCVPEPGGGLIVFARDTTEEHRAEIARDTALQATQASETKAQSAAGALDPVSDAYVTLDRDFRITYVNAEAVRLNKKPAEAFIGKLHWEEWPASVGTAFEREFRRAMTERVPVRFRERYYVPGEYDDWIDVSAYPAAEEDGSGLHVVYRDVTEQVHREHREQFLAELAERVRTLTDPQTIIADAVHSLGRFLNLSRCTFADIDRESDTCTIHLDYRADESVASIAGVLPWSTFGPYVSGELEAGRAVVVDDVYEDTAKVPSEYAAYDRIGVCAHVTVPAVHSSRLVSCISAQSATPRHWKPEEVELLHAVVQRISLTVAIARQQRERARLNDIFERVPAFMAAFQGPTHVFEMANPSYYQIVGHRKLLGRTVADALPELAEQGFVDLLNRVYATGEPFVGEGVRVFLQMEPDGPLVERFLDFTYQPLRAEDGTVRGIFIHGTDVTELKLMESERRRSEERFRSLVEATARIIWDTQADGEVVGEQPQWAAYTGQTWEAYRGMGWLDAVHPEDRAGTAYEWARAIRTQTPFLVSHRLRRHDGEYRHFAVRAVPVLEADGSVREWFGVHTDVHEQKEAERRERFLSDITGRVRALLDPEEVLYETAKAVGEYVGADRCLYIEIDEESDTLTVRRDFVQGEGIESMAGTFPLDSFGPPIVESLRAGNITLSDDTESDPRLAPEHRATFRALNFRAFLGVPLHKAGRWAATLAIHSAQPREWASDEAELLIAVVERTWLAVENARLYRAMREEVEERKRAEARAQARAERESLINQIGDGIRQSLAPEQIEANAVAALGQSLGADRCYVFTADSERDSLIISRDWHRDGIPSVVGQYRLSDLGIDVEAVFGSGETLVVPHLQGPEKISEQNAATNQQARITSLINVPFFDGARFVGALSVAMANSPREWTDEEVTLAETVAGQMRSVLEAARLQQRERNIAHQLQEALQPANPIAIPGLAMASYYRAALGEAQVGGDFHDTFELDDARSVLVVADLSGKGLSAASQVASVRNQLRYALYTADRNSDGALAAVIETLNAVLVRHEILTGFATVFVGIWDADAGTLTYVNAGQEPGLLWRASTRAVETLPPTGPVLGGFIGGAFGQRTLSLSPGDVWIAFSDGMTEVGPNRKELLGIEGVVPLFGKCCETQASPDAILARLIAGVESFARGTGIRDDVCALIAVRREKVGRE